MPVRQPVRQENSSIVKGGCSPYIPAVNRLTRQEQLVLCVVLTLLLIGWAVKAYRSAHSPARPTEQLKSKKDANSQF